MAPLSGQPPGDVLVVDDYAGVRRLIRAALKDVTAVDEAADWPAAVAELQRRPYRAVLLDLGLPGAPGPDQMIQAIRAYNPGAAIIVITGQGAEMGPLPQGVTMLAKPFDIAQLRRFVADALGRGTVGS